MTVAEATPELDGVVDRHDRAFLGHPKGLGYLAFVEGCERFSYYSMQTLLVLYMVNYLLHVATAAAGLVAFWLFKVLLAKRLMGDGKPEDAALA
jgi:POT family proton-dependent oligopeptide transporter